ncbi:hypothetical protein [Rahnella victoriana]|uniref:Uncharacterized protein n=1 Tax=Rahnella victoriana TaxID=1510570 RepID=A0ABS0DKG7_9GAMM|nr:hypothetical protein [Rahnella victoriana]MBF7954409.1 hypothetical protein [Rahnella victoriana]
MADIDDIATRIAGIILSPDSVYGLTQGESTFRKIMDSVEKKLNAA